METIGICELTFLHIYFYAIDIFVIKKYMKHQWSFAQHKNGGNIDGMGGTVKVFFF